MSSSYRLTLDRWLYTVDVNADSVLDIGGSQLPVRGRVRSWDVKKYTIADMAQPHVGSPKPDLVIDMNHTFGGMVQYDLIFCLEVFEYVYDPMTAFKNIEKLLKPGGKAWVTFPSFYPHHEPIEDDALRYMQSGIIKLAQSVELAVTEMVKRVPETNMLSVAWSSERMRAAKGFDHNVMGYIVELTK